MNNQLNRLTILLGVVALNLLLLAACNADKSAKIYQGTPFEDKGYNSGAQAIPGKLQCEYYDFGGEGIAYHDSDSSNSGSGNLNKPDGSYLHEFRIGEAVDISYTKFQDPAVDNSPYNFTEPEKDQLYVGWTDPGEWTKYTIDVETSGSYKIGIMFTSNQDGKISFSVNDVSVTDPLLIHSTYVEEDTVAWRQWHHWDYIGNLATIELEKGIQTFAIHTVEIGQMNYDYISFKLLK
jgi:hypothetical protein